MVYFTREQLVAGLRFPISSIVKQFIHFTRAPPALIHPNAIRILTGCSVLNLLYQLNILLVEVCFIYTLKPRHGGRLSTPRAPECNLLRDSPGSPDLSFDLNISMSFPGVLMLWDLYAGAFLHVYPLYSRILLINIYIFCAGKSRRGRLVNWVEKASFKKIQNLLEISKRERHHEILLIMSNLHELSRSPSPYIIPVIPRPLPT